MGTFSCARIDSRKARERELATTDENRRAVGMLNPFIFYFFCDHFYFPAQLCAIKTEGMYRGAGTTTETTACPEAGK